MRQASIRILVLLAAALGSAVPGRAVETDCLMRHPSTIIKRGDTYWIYGSGRGVRQFSSTDRLHWTDRGPAFPTEPAWVEKAVPNHRKGFLWAPDIHFFHGTYYLYYCAATLGHNTSAIGLATNATLDPAKWVDHGEVVRSPGPDPFNVMDPCIFLDASGKPWLSFGSYFSGIKVMALDPLTGTRPRPDSSITTLAEHRVGRGNAIEASCITYHDGWYYLFVNWGSCLKGDKSTYSIHVGRSRSVTGPYLGKRGVDMRDGGGTLLLGSDYDDGSGRSVSPEVGPGHAAILTVDGQDYFSCHYEWAKDKEGRTTVNIFKLTWDKGGWPDIARAEQPL